jgi:hypothetical protein
MGRDADWRVAHEEIVFRCAVNVLLIGVRRKMEGVGGGSGRGGGGEEIVLWDEEIANCYNLPMIA